MVDPVLKGGGLVRPRVGHVVASGQRRGSEHICLVLLGEVWLWNGHLRKATERI